MCDKCACSKSRAQMQQKQIEEVVQPGNSVLLSSDISFLSQPWTSPPFHLTHLSCCLTNPNPHSPRFALPPCTTLRFCLLPTLSSPVLLLRSPIWPSKSLPLSSPPIDFPEHPSYPINYLNLGLQVNAFRHRSYMLSPYADWFWILLNSHLPVSSSPISLSFIHVAQF